MSHKVYVIYYDGEPFKGNRAAYYTRRDANAAITKRENASVRYSGREENAEKVEAERRRYEVVPYVAKGVSE